MDTTVLRIVLVVTSVAFVAFILFIVQLALKQKRRRDQTLSRLGGSNGTGMLETGEYRYRYHPGARNSPSFFRVEIDASSEGSFRVTRETGFDRLGKCLGLATEIQTGDADFDEQFYLTTNANEFTQSVFSSSAKRQAVRNIFATGFTRIEHDGKTMAAVCRPFKIDREMDPTLVKALASDLATLGRQMPHVNECPVWAETSSSWKVTRAIVFATAILVSLVGPAALLIGLARFRPFDPAAVFLDSLKWSIPAWMAFTGLAFLLLKGRSSSHRELLVVLAIALTGCVLGGWGGEVTINGCFDTAEGTTRRATVMRKSQSRSNNSTSYHAHVASWCGAGSEKIRISRAEYAAIRERQSALVLRTKPGRLGFEWLEGYRLVQEDAEGPQETTSSRLVHSTGL